MIGLAPNRVVAVDGDCAKLVDTPPKIDAVLVGDVALLPKFPNEVDPNKPLFAINSKWNVQRIVKQTTNRYYKKNHNSNSQLELSETFGLQILNDWKTFEGSVELLTAALEVVVTTFVVAVLPPKIDDSALA